MKSFGNGMQFAQHAELREINGGLSGVGGLEAAPATAVSAVGSRSIFRGILSTASATTGLQGGCGSVGAKHVSRDPNRAAAHRQHERQEGGQESVRDWEDGMHGLDGSWKAALTRIGSLLQKYTLQDEICWFEVKNNLSTLSITVADGEECRVWS